MSKDLSPQYNPKEVEDKIYRQWEKSGYFNPDRLPPIGADKRGQNKRGQARKRNNPFCIIMPPPNANGALHIGHALFVTLQDIMIRYKRMRGLKTLWLPGADHAGFETQVVFDKKLEKEGRSRFQIPREELYKEMLEFTLENKKVMESQLRKLGASCDWSREKFTLDPDIVKKTQEAFIEFYQKGLVYRGERIVNWCVKHQTALADLETKYIEKKDPFYYLQYGPFVIATARPETKFGDKYVVMHPQDKRYSAYKDGQKISLEWINGLITATVIKDEAIDMKFGTGVMTITPWHDPIDFEIAERHNLDKEQIIDRQGRLLSIAGEFAGMKIEEARPKITEKLKAKGLLVKIEENYSHKVAVCYKCNHPIEPQIMPQWFLKMKPLAEKAIRAVEDGKIAFIPPRFKKTYFQWLKNIRDWNLSQQITWGIRIPAWFREESRIKNQESGEVEASYVGVRPPKGDGWKQDPDVFTTWFSSGQWPFLALGYPDSRNYKTFYPTDVMETGWDILFFWVARMVMLGIERTGKIPFKTVYLHGLVRDKERQKMSKSKGNVIDPLGVAELYGTDAVRMALMAGTAPGNDPIISEDKIRGYRNYANKLWNIARFILMQAHNPPKGKVSFSAAERARLKELQNIVKKVTRDMENFKFHLAAETVYHYIWHTLADKIIESAKPRLSAKDPKDRQEAQALLLKIFSTSLKLLHPFMPFVTEEIWGHLPIKNKKLLMIEKWPK